MLGFAKGVTMLTQNTLRICGVALILFSPFATKPARATPLTVSYGGTSGGGGDSIESRIHRIGATLIGQLDRVGRCLDEARVENVPASVIPRIGRLRQSLQTTLQNLHFEPLTQDIPCQVSPGVIEARMACSRSATDKSPPTIYWNENRFPSDPLEQNEMVIHELLRASGNGFLENRVNGTAHYRVSQCMSSELQPVPLPTPSPTLPPESESPLAPTPGSAPADLPTGWLDDGAFRARGFVLQASRNQQYPFTAGATLSFESRLYSGELRDGSQVSCSNGRTPHGRACENEMRFLPFEIVATVTLPIGQDPQVYLQGTRLDLVQFFIREAGFTVNLLGYGNQSLGPIGRGENVHTMRIVNPVFQGASVVSGTRENPRVSLVYRLAGGLGVGFGDRGGPGATFDASASLGIRIARALQIQVDQTISWLTAGLAHATTTGTLRWLISPSLSLEAYIRNHNLILGGERYQTLPNDAPLEGGIGVGFEF